MNIFFMKVKFENCLNYSLSSVVNRLAGLGCSSSCAGHDFRFWVMTYYHNLTLFNFSHILRPELVLTCL